MSTPGYSSAPSLEPPKAVALAERFVAQNGYTLAKPQPPISYESLEWGRSDEQILSLRRATLQPKAYGYSCGERGCVVIFRYAGKGAPKDVGRAVTMDAVGQSLRVEHRDIFLRAADVVLGQ